MGQRSGEDLSVTEYGAAQVDLHAYLLQRQQPMTPQQAALFAASLTEQLAALHAVGRVHGPLDVGVRVEVSNGVPQPILTGTESDRWTAADDVLGVGVILLYLLGAELSHDHRLPPRPDAMPEPLWSLITNCLEPDLTARPTAAVLAQQLRSTARDLLLGVAPWPSSTALAGPEKSSDDELHLMVPGYVPGPGPTATEEPTRSPSRRNRWLLAATTAAAVVLATVGVVLAVGGASDKAPTAGQNTPSSPIPPTASATTASATTAAVPAGPTGPAKTTAPAAQPRTSAKKSVAPPPAPTKSPLPAAPTSICVQTPDCVARASFDAVGEDLTVCDRKADSHAAVVLYTRSDASGEKKVWASDGAGTCELANLSMAEGAKITYKVCIGDQSENRVDTCSAAVTNTA